MAISLVAGFLGGVVGSLAATWLPRIVARIRSIEFKRSVAMEERGHVFKRSKAYTVGQKRKPKINDDDAAYRREMDQ